jgi:hypothetical protein
LAPQLVRIPDVPDDDLDVIPIIKELQKQQIYRSRASILEEVNSRYSEGIKEIKSDAKPRGKTVRAKPSKPDKVANPKTTGSDKERPKSFFDD